MHSIDDVAERAGVSVRTVSRILSGKQVRAETRRRVEQAMQELDYVPSAAARSLRGKKIGTIGVIGDHLTTRPHAYEIVAGIQAECERQGRMMMIGETGGSDEAFGNLVERFRQQRMDAILYATNYLHRIQIDHSFGDCPAILVNCIDEQGAYPAVIPNDRAGAKAAAEELIRLGHRRIAFLGLSEFILATAARRRGYIAALERAGIDVDERLIRTGVTEGIDNDDRMKAKVDPQSEGGDEFESLPGVLDELFSLRARPTAIMCGNDKMAIRVYFLLRERLNLRIPEDVSVVGYDDYRLIAQNLVPSLTTVDLPYYEMGVVAAKLAFDKQRKTKNIYVGCPLVVRKSASAPRK
jgi:LacI family transcriptional regulator